MDREAGGRWVEATLAIGVHGEGPTQGYRGQGTRGAHSEHGADVRDLGRVEAQRLVERKRVLPSQEERVWCWARGGLGGERARRGGGARGVQGWHRLKAGGQGMRRAHSEHVAHVRDAGRVEGQRLVERIRLLPSREERVRGGARGGPEGSRARPGGGARGVQGWHRLKAGGRGTRGAHSEHVVHVRDVGRVEAERLVERRRELPSRKAGMR